MHRATPVNTSFRAYVSGGARCLIDKADDTQEMQECKATFMNNEVRKEIESPHSYGFTSLVVESEKDNEGKIDKCAEGFGQFMGGNRTFPVVEVMDDRRFRLKNFKEGESALYDDQQQKVHIQRECVYTRSQRKVEMRVIKDQKYMDGHGSDQSASRDQQKDKSRRWSTYVMDKDVITIERTDIINDKDDGSKDKHDQDEPEQHIVMLSRVTLDKDHVHILTPHISVMWDEEKRKLILNTEKTSIEMSDEKGGSEKGIITVKTETTSIVMDDDAKKIEIKTFEKIGDVEIIHTDIKMDDQKQRVYLGDETAQDDKRKAAMYGSIDSRGDKMVAKLCKKVFLSEPG